MRKCGLVGQAGGAEWFGAGDLRGQTTGYDDSAEPGPGGDPGCIAGLASEIMEPGSSELGAG